MHPENVEWGEHPKEAVAARYQILFAFI